jgi:hypothetical protein
MSAAVCVWKSTVRMMGSGSDLLQAVAGTRCTIAKAGRRGPRAGEAGWRRTELALARKAAENS